MVGHPPTLNTRKNKESKNESEFKDVWIGLTTVKERKGHKFFVNRPVSGGFAKALTRASNYQEFVRKVKTCLAELGLDLIEIEDVELIADRLETVEMEQEWLEMARLVE